MVSTTTTPTSFRGKRCTAQILPVLRQVCLLSWTYTSSYSMAPCGLTHYRPPWLLLPRGWSLFPTTTILEIRVPGGFATFLCLFSCYHSVPGDRFAFVHCLLTILPSSTGSTNRHEAVYRLAGNAEAVTRFACRGAGRGSGWSLLPGRAPLSDPNAVPNLDILPDVDYCLRIVSRIDCTHWLTLNRTDHVYLCYMLT